MPRSNGRKRRFNPIILARQSIDLGDKATDDQRQATEAFIKWLQRPDERFVLAGYAGTGKTHMVSRWLSALDAGDVRVAVGCLTNRAAGILRSKGVYGATTIHSLLYSLNDRRSEMSKAKANLRKAQADHDEAVAGRRPEKEKLKAWSKVETCMAKVEELMDPSFEKAESRRGDIPKLILIDEASMVPRSMMDDLEDVGPPVVYSGDPGQLPPVSGGSAYHALKRNATLKEIVRQDDDSLLGFATEARQRRRWGKVAGSIKRHGDNPLSPVVESTRGSGPFGPDAAVALAHSNKLRYALNAEVRILLGRTSPLPEPGDVLVASQTPRPDHPVYSYMARTQRVYNGSQYRVEEIVPHGKRANVLRATLSDPEGEFDCLLNGRWFEWFDQGVFDKSGVAFAKIEVPMQKEVVEGVDGMVLECGTEDLGSSGKWIVPVVEFQWGYALTVHKAQGGEWRTVVLFDDHRERREASEDYGRWLYTAATRAKQELLIGHAKWPLKTPPHASRRLQALRRRWRKEAASEMWAWPITLRGARKLHKDENKAQIVAVVAMANMAGMSRSAVEDAASELGLGLEEPVTAKVETLVELACKFAYQASEQFLPSSPAAALYAAASTIKDEPDLEDEVERDLKRTLRVNGDLMGWVRRNLESPSGVRDSS